MNTRKGRRVAMGAVVAGLIVLGVAGYALKDRVVEEYWLYWLEHGDHETKDTAATKLGQMKSVRAVPLLVAWLCTWPGGFGGQSNPEGGIIVVFFYGECPAAYALTSIGRPAVVELSRVLRNADSGVASAIVAVLRDIGPGARGALPVLFKRMADSDETLSLMAIDAARHIDGRGEDSIVVLEAALRHPSRAVRASAAEALLDIEGRNADPR